MTSRVTLGIGTLLAAAAVASGALAEEGLRFDPFDRPSAEALAALQSGRGGPVEGAWAPVLRATLVDGAASMANLGGDVLSLGDTTHGFRLLEVSDWEAVFERAGERIVLPVSKASGGAR